MIHYRNKRYTSEGVLMDPASPAFRHGAGLYETVYYNGRDVLHLHRHLDRVLSSLRACGIPYAAVDFDEVVGQVLNRNGLEDRPARVDIFYPLEPGESSPVITAAPHEPKPYKAYRLCLCDDRHVSTLNALRSASRMFFHLALRQALARGFDDAALLDLNDDILEASTGALVFEKHGHFVCADSPYRLPSIALELAATVLDILPVRLPLAELESFRHAYLLNSLIGMRPVVAVGETAFVPDSATCDKVTPLILGGSD